MSAAKKPRGSNLSEFIFPSPERSGNSKKFQGGEFFPVWVCVGFFILWLIALVDYCWPDGTALLLNRASTAARAVETAAYTLFDEDVAFIGLGEANGVQHNGQLRVENGQLVNHHGKPMQLRGMSSHGLAWYPEYTSYASVRTTKEHGANMFRIAMYVDLDKGNYSRSKADQAANKNAMYTAIDGVLAMDMYAIADWHILEQGNPLDRLACAIDFFDGLSRRYAGSPGLLYEICNAPNGGATWEDIAQYAEVIIPVIRKNAPDAVVIVGTPEHSTEILAAAESPLPYENVLYAYHCKTGDGVDARVALDAARQANVPVFISEWSIDIDPQNPAQGEAHAVRFAQYAANNNLSWANWSLCNKREGFSAIAPDTKRHSGWTEDDLTASGRVAFAVLGAN